MAAGTCRWPGLAFLLVLLAAPPAASEEWVEVKGRVLDRGDTPVEGVDVALRWTMHGDDAKPEDPVRTNADGGFVLQGQAPALPVAVLAMDGDRRRGAAAALDRSALRVVQRLHLATLSRVRGELRAPGLEGDPTNRRVAVEVQGSRVIHAGLVSPTFSLLLPPGEYELVAGAKETMEARRPLRVEEGRDQDLGVIELVPTLLASAYRQPAPPLSVVTEDGSPATTSWEALRGRWVLVVFWSVSSGPSTRGTLPRAIETVERYAKRRDQFEVLAVHDASATPEELRKGLAALGKDAWGGKALPFPVLLDSGGETAARYGVTDVPAEFLVDPEGRLQPGGLDELAGILGEDDPEVDEIEAALERANHPNTIEPLLARLAAKKTRRSAAALTSYADSARGAATPLAFLALAKHGSPEAMDHLVGPKGLKSKSGPVQDAAIAAAHASRDPSVVGPLVVIALGVSSRAKAVAAALRALRELSPENEDVRRRSPDLVKNASPDVREAAVHYLGQVGTTQAFDLLKDLLQKDAVPAVREAAAVALGTFGRPEARPALERAVKDDGALRVREAARRALETLEGRAAGGR